MCGKYYLKVRKRTAAWGSPPRVREVYPMIIPASLPPRITPACAGSMGFLSTRNRRFGDHPRVCGKYIFYALRYGIGKGSPPRVREVYKWRHRCFKRGGITPACAGSIFFKDCKKSLGRDHPRVCGKYKF